MTKADMVELITDKTSLTAKDVKMVVDNLLEEIKSSLVKGKHLEIRGFGTFKVKNVKARKARNPKTNKEVDVPARKKAVFNVSKDLNAILN